METEVKVLTEAKVKLNHEIDAVVLELKNRDQSVEKSVEVLEKRIQEITQENQKFKQEKVEIEKNKSMLEVAKAEENNPKLQKELDAMKIDYENQKKEIKILKNQIDNKERHKKRLNEAFTQFESEVIELKTKLEYAESSKGTTHILRKHLYSTKLALNTQFLTKTEFFRQNKRASLSTLHFDEIFMLKFENLKQVLLSKQKSFF
jgi:chromosome segregation ATPase